MTQQFQKVLIYIRWQVPLDHQAPSLQRITRHQSNIPRKLRICKAHPTSAGKYYRPMTIDKPGMFLPVMKEAALAGGAILSGYFSNREHLLVNHKSASDFVSTADIETEAAVHAVLKAGFPDFGAWLEEGGRHTGNNPDYQWIVDPLDGTTNFLFGIPHFAVSIGLAYQGIPVAGVVLNPAGDELFMAAAGMGAMLNEQPIRCASRERLEHMLLGTGLPFKGKTGHAGIAAELVAPMQQCAGIRRIGAASLDLCYVACGRFDAFWEHQLQPWDVAAGIVIVREAGGIVTRLDGSEDPMPYTDIIAASPTAYSPVKELLHDRH
jgi:myo-inositol-1(or 4)-monophosphatase